MKRESESWKGKLGVLLTFALALVGAGAGYIAFKTLAEYQLSDHEKRISNIERLREEEREVPFMVKQLAREIAKLTEAIEDLKEGR